MLTDSEKKVIRSTWAQAMENRHALGLDIFLTLFEMFPETQDMFRDFKGLSRAQLESSARLKAHGLRVVNTLDGSIASLDDMEVCAESLVLIGTSHKSRGVTKKHFEDLNIVLDRVFTKRLGNVYTDNKETWAKLLNAIVPVIAKGLD